MKKNRTRVRGSSKVVIGVNDPATRAGIRVALAGDVRVCAEVDCVTELIEAVERHHPDACLVDVDLNGGGIEAAAELAVLEPHVAVVLVTAGESEPEFLAAIRAGAIGYLNKSISPSALVSVLHAVLAGEPAIPRALVPALINEYRDRPTRRQITIDGGSDLTEREWQVVTLMREGMSTRDIAGRLLISEVTVRRHIGAAVKKLHVDSRADALKLLQSA